jgi:predicted MFS family arabinose efflux permease
MMRRSTTSGASAPAGRPFLGWRVVAGAFSSQLLSNTLCFNAFGVFILPLADAFDTTRGVVGSGIGILLVAQGLLGPLLGRAIDRGPVRGIMVSGVILLCAGLFLTSHAAALWQAALTLGLLMAVGAGMTGPIATIPLVGKWFVRRRGLALGLTVAGATVAAMTGPALAAFLIETQGWRQALRSMAAGGVLIGVPLLSWLVIRRPEDVGQRPDGDPVALETPPAVLSTQAGASELLRDPNLWLVSFAFAFLFASPIVVSTHLVPFADDLGVDSLRAAAFFSVMVPFSLLGKLLFGVVVDRVETRHAVFSAIGLLAVTWVLLLSEPSYGTLLAAGGLFGLGVGAVGPMQGFVIASCFGRHAVGQVMGLGGLLGLPVVAGAAPLVGFLFDSQGSYQVGFLLQLATLGISALFFGLMRIPEVEPGTELPAGAVAAEGA